MLLIITQERCYVMMVKQAVHSFTRHGCITSNLTIMQSSGLTIIKMVEPVHSITRHPLLQHIMVLLISCAHDYAVMVSYHEELTGTTVLLYCRIVMVKPVHSNTRYGMHTTNHVVVHIRRARVRSYVHQQSGPRRSRLRTEP